MYCHTCGNQNRNHDIYCSNDGTVLRKIDVKINTKHRGIAFCASCGHQTGSTDSYCSNCGKVLLSTQAASRTGLGDLVKTNTSESTNTITAIKLPKFQLNYKQTIISTVLAFAIVIILSLFLMISSKSILNSLFQRGMDGMEIMDSLSYIENDTDITLPKMDSIIGFSDYIMAEHLLSPKLEAGIKGEIFGETGNFSGKVNVGLGILIYMIIPFIGLILAGVYAGRKMKMETLASKFQASIGIGIFYAIILAIFSLFSGYSKNIKIDEGSYNIAIHFSVDYSFFFALLSGLIFGILFSFIGILFAKDFRKSTAHLKVIPIYGQAIHQGLSVFFRGFGLITLIMLIILWIVGSQSEFMNLIEDIFGTVTASNLKIFYYLTFAFQFGFYIWSLIQLSPFRFTGNINGEKESLSYHVFSGFKGEGNINESLWVLDNALSSHNIDLYLKFAVIIPIALFLYAGYRIAKSNSINWKAILVFSLVYSIIMGVFASYTNFEMLIKVEGTGMEHQVPQSIFLGFHPWSVFIYSFIISFLVSYGGSYLFKILAKR